MFDNLQWVTITSPRGKRMPTNLAEAREKIINETEDVFIPVAKITDSRDFVCFHFKVKFNS